MTVNELYHYGVKGMKWGVLRQRQRDVKQAYKAKKRNSIDIWRAY